MDALVFIRLAYLAATAGGLLVAVTPALRQRFLAYGPRASPAIDKENGNKVSRKTSKSSIGSANVLSSLLDTIAAWTVPHDYFWTFYALSTSLSIFWATELFLLKGPTFQAIASHTYEREASMSFEKVKVTWALMFLQGVRRLYECFSLAPERKSESKMQAWHWVLGLLFYSGMSVAVWVEGIPALQKHEPSLSSLLCFHAPNPRTFGSVLIFILASGIQHDCHTYLAHLKSSKSTNSNAEKKRDKYKIPTHPAFHSLIAPHYTAECAIYLALAVVAAPNGRWMNRTLAWALVFVVTNLGITAKFTRTWYEERFGAEAVKGKWNLVPWLW